MIDTAKPSWIVRIPTPIWLIVLIVVALMADRLFALPAYFQYKAIGIALIVLGVAVSVSGNFTFRKRGAEIIPSSEVHSTLVQSGLYRITRNPMYLGLVIIGIGAALVAGTWLMWLVPIVIFALDNFVIIPFEERSMERVYGDAFREYKTRVRRWV